jgi:hypothetical protein
MKNFLSSLFAAKQEKASIRTEPNGESIDLRKIRFTMPTVAADELRCVVPTPRTFEDAPQFHEDEWSQLEFFTEDRFAEIQRMLSKYKAFEKKHRTSNGWTEIYARKIHREPLIESEDAIGALETLLGFKRTPSPILTTTSSALGQVEGGFSLRHPGPVLLYGLGGEKEITSLAAIVERSGDDYELTKVFSLLNRAYQLILVDWRAQMILASAQSSGEINVWRP